MRCRLIFKNTKKQHFSALLILIVSVIGFGCQSSSSKQSSKTPAIARINIHDEPQALDPRKARNVNSQAIVQMLFEGLTRANKLGKPELALAERFDVSSDLKTYTFHLKEALWSNGERVVASDFVYAWKKVLSPDFPSDTAFLMYVIKNAKAAKEGKVSIDEIGARAINDKTLQIVLENPTPYFLELLGSAVFFPVNQKIDEKNPQWALDVSTYVGNGPFVLKTWKHHDLIEVQRNQKYWDASSVKMDGLAIHMVNEETELKLFEKKQLDWAGSPLSTLPLDALKSLKEGNLLKTKKGLATYFIRTNTQLKPFNHPLIRKAFALAINRRLIVDHVTQGGQVPATGLVPIAFGLQKQAYFEDGDVENARRLFQEGLTLLNMKKEQLPEISYTYRMTERNHLIAQAIQQQWFEAFGIRVKLEALEAKVFFNRVSKQDYQLAYGDWVADFADPVNFLEVFKYKNGGSNNTLWENAQYVNLLEQSYKSADPAKRLELLSQSEQILMDEMPVIPVLHTNMLYLNQPGLKDVVLSSMGAIDFKWASFSKAEEGVIAKGELK